MLLDSAERLGCLYDAFALATLSATSELADVPTAGRAKVGSAEREPLPPAWQMATAKASAA